MSAHLSDEMVEQHTYRAHGIDGDGQWIHVIVMLSVFKCPSYRIMLQVSVGTHSEVVFDEEVSEKDLLDQLLQGKLVYDLIVKEISRERYPTTDTDGGLNGSLGVGI
jgi:hypothetical protein